MLILVVVLAAGVLLAFANGANDNFKGVATLYGSGTASYRGALVWATLATACGSLLAMWLAGRLLERFSGKGIISDQVVAQGEFGAGVAVAAGITVLLATRLGFPVSTTHALVGAMVGASAASHFAVHWQVLGTSLVAPLLLSPLVALTATAIAFPMFRQLRLALGINKETCLCAGRQVVEVVPVCTDTVALMRAEQLSISLGTIVTCRDRYAGKLMGIDAGDSLDTFHFLSAGLVGFARGLNDTPKIAALLLVAPALTPFAAIAVCGIAIALGGWLGAKRVAENLSHRITAMNAGQGFCANLVTAVLVTSASRWGLPVSTTHVSCGALFGIGAVTGEACWRFVGQILLAWITTLPCAAALGWLLLSVLG